MNEHTDIKSLEYSALESFVTEELGEKKFRTGQIFSWLHEKKARSFDEMTNLSKELREKLAEKTVLTTLAVEEVQTSKIDRTKKYLFALPDGNFIESVLITYKAGTSVCVQVGCAMGCSLRLDNRRKGEPCSVWSGPDPMPLKGTRESGSATVSSWALANLSTITTMCCPSFISSRMSRGRI